MRLQTTKVVQDNTDDQKWHRKYYNFEARDSRVVITGAYFGITVITYST